MSFPNNGNGYRGYADPESSGSELNAQTLLIKNLLSKVSTTTLVKVLSVTNSGGLSAVGFVDILPLVNQLDGAGNAIPHQTIYACPYFRLQGGADAVILDPTVGDIGIALFADRDISSVIANKGQANPGSRRRHDMADGLYIGGTLNGTPSQYVRFSAEGIECVSPKKITLTAPEIEANASTSFKVNSPQSTFSNAVAINGLLTFLGGMVGSAVSGAAATITGVFNFVGQVFANGKRIDDTHTHSGVQSGGSNSGTVN